jgi:tetraacyldisaccharide-1-P 4'-kinase
VQIKNIMDLTEFEKEYRSWKPVWCPYLGEEVIFNSHGFSHLIWKNRDSKRHEDDISIRMNSLKYVREIIQKSGTLQEHEDRKKSEYYAFIAIGDKKKFKVVVAKTKNEEVVFVSIIPNWNTGKRDLENSSRQIKNPSRSG